ncbi:MAG: serpin family protein, partial [Bacteroidales bacterium]|nr:serpin family protein [Bacteroidales bacterium]
IVILLKRINYIDSIENVLTPLNFDFWTSELYTKLVSVSLPKFRSEFRQDVSYAISDMDCELAFTQDADFSRISSQKVHISEVIQHTVIEIEENKNNKLTELYINPKEQDNIGTEFIRFNANKPFIYIVRDNVNKSILIMGKVVSPNFDMISAQIDENDETGLN